MRSSLLSPSWYALLLSLTICSAKPSHLTSKMNQTLSKLAKTFYLLSVKNQYHIYNSIWLLSLAFSSLSYDSIKVDSCQNSTKIMWFSTGEPEPSLKAGFTQSQSMIMLFLNHGAPLGQVNYWELGHLVWTELQFIVFLWALIYHPHL